MHFSRLALHFVLSFAIFANGVMVSAASARSLSDTATMQSQTDEHEDLLPAHHSHEAAAVAKHHHSHGDAVAADQQHGSSALTSNQHSHHFVVGAKCGGKTCRHKCNCGCGVGFCASNVASLSGSSLASFLLTGSDDVPFLYGQSFTAARDKSPLRPPIS